MEAPSFQRAVDLLKKSFVVEWTRDGRPPIIEAHFTDPAKARLFSDALGAAMPMEKVSDQQGYNGIYGLTTVAFTLSAVDYERWDAALARAGIQAERIASAYDLAHVNIPGAEITFRGDMVYLSIGEEAYRGLAEEAQLLFAPGRTAGTYVAEQNPPPGFREEYIPHYQRIEGKIRAWSAEQQFDEYRRGRR